MKTKMVATFALAGAVAIAALTGTAFATAEGANPEAEAMKAAKVSLPQAIATAEAKTGGHAYDVGVDNSGGKPRILVETSGPTGVQTVTIDAVNGQVISSHAGSEPD